MFESKGRKNIDIMLNGQMYIVKKPISIAGSVGVLLPKDWLEAVSMGKNIKYFLLDMRDTEVVIKPHYEDIAELQEDVE